MIEIISNPYSGVDWANTPRVKAVSHEHVFTMSQAARMYDRGIRFFGHLHYQPAVPRCPLSNFSGTFEDWCYYDASFFYKTGDKSTKQTYTAVEARKAVPDVVNGCTMNLKMQGLTVGYLDSNRDNRWTQLLRDLNDGETWNELCEDETAWVERTWDDVDEHLVMHTKSLSGSIPTFTSAASASAYSGKISSVAFAGDGLTHNTDDFPQIPNCEHAYFKGLGHFNVLGSRASEASSSLGAPTDWRGAHKFYDIDDIGTVLGPQTSFYDGKLFGTQNHNNSVSMFTTLQDKYTWFKGIEVYNNGMSIADWNSYMNTFHQLLNMGREVYCLSVVDWQNDYNGSSDVDAGTNVLYMPSNYESLSVSDKAKAGLDTYIAGRIVASRYGSRNVTNFSIDTANNTVTFRVSSQAKKLSLVFNGKKFTQEDVSEITMSIPNGSTNVTGEAWFGDGNGQIYKSSNKLADDADFLFTQAIKYSGSSVKDDGRFTKEMVMFALDD